MKFNKIKKYSNKKTALNNGRKQAKFYPKNNKVSIMATNTSPNDNKTNRPKTYHKRNKSAAKNKTDLQRTRKTLLNLLDANFPMVSNNVFFLTLEFKDHRYKKVNSVRKKILAYFKKIDVKGVGIVELDSNHHPHCHVIITASHKLDLVEVENNWQYGYSYGECIANNTSWDRLVNYLVKVYKDGENINFNKAKADALDKQVRIYKDKVDSVLVDAFEEQDPSLKAKFNKEYSDLLKKYKLYKSLQKKERQKQLTIGDSPLIRSRGLNDKPVIIKDEDIINAIADNGKFINSTSSKLNGIDEETGEIIYDIRYQFNQYKIDQTLAQLIKDRTKEKV